MARQITLNRVTQLNANQSCTDTYTASAGVDMPNEIFVMRQLPLDPANPTGAIDIRFENVATPADLSSLPINNPLSNVDPRFRVISFLLSYNTRVDADDGWQAIQEDVAFLVDALNIADITAPSTTVVITGFGT